MRGYNENQVIHELTRLGVIVGPLGIVIPEGLRIGIKTWGKIDFLRRRWRRV